MHAGYATALRLAREEFSAADPERMALMSGCSWLADSQCLALPFLGRPYQVAHPQGKVTCHGQEATVAEAILALHYLTGASGAARRGEFISFGQLPGGEIYLEPFRQRTVALLLKFFAADPQRLWDAAERLGGQRQGNQVTVFALPRVPITLTLWPGDDELAANGSVLYDASAPLYLPTEDLIVLASSTIIALMQAGRDQT